MPGLQNTKSTLDFLGTLGTSDRGDSVKLNNTVKAMVQLAGFLIEEATNNLEKKGNIATGNTASSMKIVNLDLKAPKMSLDVEILSTYKFLDQGVKGVEGGSGKFSFKNKFVGRKMLLAIERWLRIRGKGGKIKYKAVSKNEAKNKSINKMNESKKKKALAWAVAKSIKKKGIKRTLFFANAIKATQKKQKALLSNALKVDIIETLKLN
jgi:hypothetical protein